MNNPDVLIPPPLTVSEGKKTRIKLPLASEEEIDRVAPSTKLFFGDGLYLIVNKRGSKKTFKARISLGGKSVWKDIGEYPDLSFSQAKDEAVKLQKEAGTVRRKKNNERAINFIVEKSKPIPPVKKMTDKPDPGFKSLSDVGEFIGYLRADNQNLTSDAREIRLAIWLQMLMPWRVDELLEAQLSDFPSQNTNVWNVKSEIGRQTQNFEIQTEPLSQQIVFAMNELRQLTRTQNYLFPNLASKTKSERNKIIASEIENIWMKYTIEKSTFKNFFLFIAYRRSFFRPEFINATMKHKCKTGQENIFDKMYSPQRWALVEWWSNELNVMKYPNPTINWKNF